MNIVYKLLWKDVGKLKRKHKIAGKWFNIKY